jgi:SAM-dependent methyltransferase
MVSKWILKALVQKGISYLPQAEKINYFLQKHVTRGVLLTDEHFGQKLQHAREHHRAFLKHGTPGPDANILELGTGWYPVIPLYFYLTTSGRVISVDIQRWMTGETQQLTFRKLLEWRERGLLDELMPRIDESRWARVSDLARDPFTFSTDQVSTRIGLTTLVKDARNLEMDDGSVDFICSNNTLEHIPEKILAEIFLEFGRVLSPGGFMSHFIDMSDHFAHFDTRISIYNFLKFSEKQWKLLDNRIQPQNRLRFRDYLRIYNETGHSVIEQETREGELEALKNIRVHAEFSGYTPAELAISHATLISQKQFPDHVI